MSDSVWGYAVEISGEPEPGSLGLFAVYRRADDALAAAAEVGGVVRVVAFHLGDVVPRRVAAFEACHG